MVYQFDILMAVYPLATIRSFDQLSWSTKISKSAAVQKLLVIEATYSAAAFFISRATAVAWTRSKRDFWIWARGDFDSKICFEVCGWNKPTIVWCDNIWYILDICCFGKTSHLLNGVLNMIWKIIVSAIAQPKLSKWLSGTSTWWS